MEVKILKGRILLPLNEGFIEVKALTEDTKPIKGFGYFDPEQANCNKDPYVYIYRGKYKNEKEVIPGSVYMRNGIAYWVEHNPEDKEDYCLDKCKSIGLHEIKKTMENDEIEPKKISDSEDFSDGDFFMPQIRPTDDILKRIIKSTLQQMRINLKTLKPKFNNDYDLNNLKSQLVKEGSMSTKYFSRWVEILGIEIEVVIKDQEGRVDKPITIIMK